MIGEFLAAVPGQRAQQLGGHRGHRRGEGVLHRDGAVAPEGRSVLHRRNTAVSLHAGQVNEQRVAAGALDHSSDGGPVQPDDQVALPVPRDRSVLSLGRPLAEHDLGGDVTLRLVA